MKSLSENWRVRLKLICRLGKGIPLLRFNSPMSKSSHRRHRKYQLWAGGSSSGEKGNVVCDDWLRKIESGLSWSERTSVDWRVGCPGLNLEIKTE